MKAKLLCCIGTDSHITNPNLLHHFIAYYSALGITEWALTLHCGRNPAYRNLQTYQQILDSHEMPYDVWEGVFDTYEREARHNALVRRQDDDVWMVGVDLDEFVAFPKPIPQYLEEAAASGYNSVTGYLLDRVSCDGTLKHIERDLLLCEQFPVAAEVKRHIYKPLTPKAPYEKKVAIKKPLQWGLGHHFIHHDVRVFELESPDHLEINHYAWDDLLIGRIQERLSDAWAEEYQNMIRYIQRYGRLRLRDVRVKRRE